MHQLTLWICYSASHANRDIMIVYTKNGKQIKVDYKDYKDFVEDRCYSISNHGYVRIIEFRKYKYLHRLIMGVTDKKQQVDHINGDRADNRRENLRIVNNQQNNCNKPPVKGKYKGVHFSNKERKWIAQITVNYNCTALGRFDTAEKAALAYNEAAKKFHGEYAYLNNIE